MFFVFLKSRRSVLASVLIAIICAPAFLKSLYRSLKLRSCPVQIPQCNVRKKTTTVFFLPSRLLSRITLPSLSESEKAGARLPTLMSAAMTLISNRVRVKINFDNEKSLDFTNNLN